MGMAEAAGAAVVAARADLARQHLAAMVMAVAATVVAMAVAKDRQTVVVPVGPWAAAQAVAMAVL